MGWVEEVRGCACDFKSTCSVLLEVLHMLSEDLCVCVLGCPEEVCDYEQFG